LCDRYFLVELTSCCVLFHHLAEIEEFKADNDSFLFLLNYGGNFSEKINLKPGASGGIHCQEFLGPAFGTTSYFDVQLWNNYNKGLSLLYFGHGYVRPPNFDRNSLFIGEETLSIEEMEVFKVNFFQP